MANEDQDPIPDFEPDGDFTEFEEEKTESSLGSTIKNSPLLKLGLIAAGLIIVVGGIMLLGGQEEKAENSRVVGAGNLKETPGTAELSPAMKDAMDEFNEQNLTSAINTGQSAIPIPTDPPKDFLPVPTDAAANEDPLQRWRQMQEERMRVQREQEQMQSQMAQTSQADPAVQQAVEGLSSAMMTHFSSIVEERRGLTRVTSLKVTDETQLKAASGQSGSGLPGQAGAGTGLEARVPKEIVIPAGSVLYAQLLNEANSDVLGPIVALLAQGPFSGSRVLGTFSKSEELLTMNFNTLVTKEGFSVPIQAIAMDPDTTLVGMATEVDHRYWKRILLPAAAEFISGVGEAIAKEGTTTVVISGSTGTTATEDNSSLDTKQELAQGAEKAFDKVSEIVSEEGDETEILVIVHAGTPLGLLFMESVTKNQINDARYEAPKNQQPEEQNPMLGLVGLTSTGQPATNAYGQPVSQYPGSDLPSSLLQSLQAQQNVQNGAAPAQSYATGSSAQ